jgi:PAS domain S-box-containing protein
MRTLASGEEIRNEDVIQVMADGTRLTIRCNCSPIYDDEERIVAGVFITQDITERKRAQEALEESEERFRATFEQAAVGISHNALDGTWLRVNQRLCGILGYSREELLQKTFQEITHPDDLDADQAYTRQLLAGEIGSFSMEKRYIRKDGSIVWGNLTVSLVREPSGEPSYSIAVIEDITERKQAEEKIRFQAHLLGVVGQAVIATNLKGRITYWNRHAEDLYGFSAEEVRGRSIMEVTPAEGQLERAEEIMSELRAGRSWSGEFEVRRKDGTSFPAMVTDMPVHDEQGDLVSVIGISTDITERKRAEKEIERHTYQQAAVAKLGIEVLASDDLQTLMDEATALVARTLEVEYAKVVELLSGGEELLLRAGVGWREGLVGEARESAGVGSEAGYTLSSEEPVIMDDLRTEERFSTTPLLEDHGVVSGMSVVIHGQEGPFGALCAHTRSRRTFSEDDINFLQAVANVLATAIEREAAEQSQEGVREVERSRIARDLHDDALQDLSGAIVDAQLLRRRFISKEDPETIRKAEQLLAALDRIGPRLREAIYDLRLEAEQERPFFELLESLVELQRTVATESEISLQMGDERLYGPLGKTGRELLRILREALINARRHSGAEHVRVEVWASEEMLWAEVEDDGRGFDPSQEASTTSGGGMGMRGMRERARALGADLKIQSEPGKGTKVRFELALEPESEQPEKEEVRVLLVEDHASIREALASTFEGEGFEVVGQAGALSEARSILEEMQRAIDVAVIDLGLPDGYGGDLIKDLRDAYPQAQALVLSATLDRANIAHAVERGAAGVVHKTAPLEEVLQAVRRLRAGETLLPLEEVVELLRFAGSRREEDYEARQAIVRLTPREIEVLQALAEGLDSEGIAEKLHIALRTERNHMANILAKLGVHSQLQALVFALRHGVVEVP